MIARVNPDAIMLPKVETPQQVQHAPSVIGGALLCTNTMPWQQVQALAGILDTANCTSRVWYVCSGGWGGWIGGCVALDLSLPSLLRCTIETPRGVLNALDIAEAHPKVCLCGLVSSISALVVSFSLDFSHDLSLFPCLAVR